MRILIALVALIALYPNQSDACSCIGSQPACAAVWNADDVFSGTVLEIKNSASGKRVTVRADRGLLSRIWGQVLIRNANDEWTPLTNVAVDLHRGDDVWTTTSSAEGRFEFVDLPPALYHVFARDYLVETGFTSARLRAPSACAELTLFVKRPPGP